MESATSLCWLQTLALLCNYICKAGCNHSCPGKIKLKTSCDDVIKTSINASSFCSIQEVMRNWLRPQLPVPLPSTWTLAALEEAERKGLGEFPFLCCELAT